MDRFRELKSRVSTQVSESLLEMQDTGHNFSRFMKKHRRKIAVMKYGLACLTLALLLFIGTADVVVASDPGGQVFTRATTAMQGVLRQIRTISSIIAALFLTIAFLMKMFSKNQRTVDEANTWIKRIIIAWACINAVGFILTFIQEISSPDAALPTLT